MKTSERIIQFGSIFILALGAVVVTLSYAPVAARPQPPMDSGSLTILVSKPVTPTKGITDFGIDQAGGAIVTGHSVKNDTSPFLREIPPAPLRPQKEHMAMPRLGVSATHLDAPDPVVQRSLGPLAMPGTILNFDGIPFPGVACNCAPPDTNGEVGTTQYVQMVNEGLQVFNKTTGASVLGPIGITTVWSGFGGVCEFNGAGDPIVLFDQLASRWIISQFAGTSVPTDECIAVSTSDDATGAFHRYDFHLGTNFFDYPKLGVWPDAYYMGMNVFNTAGTFFLGPQPFAFDRAAMLVGAAATFVTFSPLSTGLGMLMPADLDGSILPPAGAPNPWMGAAGATWPVYRFHVDFVTPASSTFTLATSLTPAAYSELCPTTRSCVPQLGTTAGLDGIGELPMFRLAYRRFGDGHEALVGNLSVSSGGVAGIRWWEINNATSGTPSFVQESTYQPDTTWRWLGSIAMDTSGDIAMGFSASSGSINPQIRYAGRLRTDPTSTLAQGEATLFAGTGSQTGTGNRWGDYSDLTVDPVDDCTFWYTNEYYATTGSFNWKTRIGNFKFPSCSKAPDFSLSVSPGTRGVCAPANAVYTATVGSLSGFSSAVTLNASGQPALTTASFSVNPVTPPGNSILTIGNTGAASAGSYNINVVGISPTRTHTSTVMLDLSTASPGVPTLTAPANGASGTAANPTFSWTAVSQATSYILEIATDAGFTNIVHSAPGLTGTTYNGASLDTSMTYYWRVRASNACGPGTNSAAFSFTTVAAPGDCSLGTTPNLLYSNDFEAGASGWTHNAGVGSDTWVTTTVTPHSGAQSWHADDLSTVSDQRLVSPGVALPSGQNPVVLKFWSMRNLENNGTTACFDGGILEVTTDGGSTWTQLTAPNLLTDPYDGAVSLSFSNPLAGLNAWCGIKSYLHSIVDLNAYAGQTVQFRFRLGTDNSVSKPGWNIDDVAVRSCRVNSAPVLVSVNAAPSTINENKVITLTGTLTDLDPLDIHTLTIGWGGGGGTLTQTLPTLGVGVYTFSATHQYLDDTPTGTPTDINTIHLALTDNYTHTIISTTHVIVNNVPPAVNVGPDLVTQQNAALQFNGAYTDPGTLDTHIFGWNFGDGSAILTGTLTPTHIFTVTGTFTTTLTVTDDDTGVGSDSLVVQVKPWIIYLPNVSKNP